METQAIFYKGKWRRLNDLIGLIPFYKWKLVEFLDRNTALLERGDKYKVIKGEVRTSEF